MLNQNSILSSNTSGSGSADGDVIGPASSTDNAVVRYNGTTGKLVQNSAVTIDDSGKVSVGTNAAFGATLGQFNGTNAVIANTAGQFSIGTTDTAAADLGGSLGFTANTTTLAGYPMGSISGRLIATGAGAYQSYMAFATTDAGGTVAERMRLTDTGLNSTAIGATTASTGAFTTLSATGVLSVSDAINYTGAGAMYLRSRLNGGTVFVGTESTGGTLYYPITISGTNDTLTFSNQTGEAMRINSAGNVGIGTASPAAKLDIVSTGSSRAIQANDSDTATTGYQQMMGLQHSGSDMLSITTGPWTTVAFPEGGAIFNTGGVSNVLTMNSSGNVGIGTGSPAHELHVVASDSPVILLESTAAATAASSYTALKANSGSGGNYFRAFLGQDENDAYNWGVGNFSSDKDVLAFYSGGLNERMRIDASGNVGIGTAAPGTALEISRSSGSTQLTMNGISGGYKDVILETNGSARWRFGADNDAESGSNVGTDFYINSFSDAGAYLSSPFWIKRSSGNVGIGTSSPTDTLSVNGGLSVVRTGAVNNININDASGNLGATLSFLGSASGTGKNWQVGNQIQASDTLTFTPSTATGGSTFTTPTLTLTGAGDVIIGGTVVPSGSTNAIAVTDPTYKYLKCSKNSTANRYQIQFYNPNGLIGSVTTNGSATAYNTSSDYRLKENVVPMQDALQRITQLKPSRFNFIADDSVVVDGFIAHEVQEHVPEAISGEKDAMQDEEYEVTPAVLDDDGNEITPAVMDTRLVPDYQGIDQSKLVPLLVGAIQELTARIAALENN